MAKAHKVAAGIVVLAIAIFGTLWLVEPAWASPTCMSCNYNFGNCISHCSTQACEDNCWEWYDICQGSCWGGTTENSCIAACPSPAYTCALFGTNWYCSQYG